MTYAVMFLVRQPATLHITRHPMAAQRLIPLE